MISQCIIRPHENDMSEPSATTLRDVDDRVLLRSEDGAAELRAATYWNVPLLTAVVEEVRDRFEIEPRIQVFGKETRQPRDVFFASDVSVGYFYSNQVMRSQELSPNMKALLDDINQSYGASFNGILINRYKDGTKSVGKHADSEDGLNQKAGVVAISYGASRKFRITDAKTKKRVGDYEARHGEILQMKGTFQKKYLHEIPKEKKVKEERISVTFRQHDPEKEKRLLDKIEKNKRKREL